MRQTSKIINHTFDFKIGRHGYMTLLQPSLEYDCKVWNSNKCQNKALEFIQLCAGKFIFWVAL